MARKKQNDVLPEIIEPVELSDKEEKMRNQDIRLLSRMREERDRSHMELDGMDYIQYYDSNRKKDLSYLQPKVNKHDVMIASGVTREKDTSLLSLALSMNFEPDIKAFNADDLEVNEYGDTLSDLNKKSRELEEWAKKRSNIYRELIAQGDVFVQEMFKEQFGKVSTTNINWNPVKDNLKDFKYTARLKKLFGRCEARMISGKKLYVSNIYKEWLDEQGQVAVLNVYNRDVAYGMYGKWERWENVPSTIETYEFEDDGTYRSWNMTPLTDENQVAEILMFDVVNNRFQIYLNGVPMLPHDYLLTLVSPSGQVPIAHGKGEPISNFFYSKSQPSKTKVEEDVLNETTKLMVEGMRIGNKPPMGSRKAKVLSRNVLVAGKISPDMREGDLFPLLTKTGLTPSDFSFYQLIRKSIDDKTVTPSFTGQQQGGDPTATQVTQEKEQQMVKLGLLLDGIIGLETRMTWLRTYDILANWTKKYDADFGGEGEKMYGQHRSFSVDTNFGDGKSGTKIFRFNVGGFPSIEEQYNEEQKLGKEYGKEVRLVYMNPELMRKMKEKFFVTVVATPQNNDMLSQIVYIQNLRQAIELFGYESLNMEYAKQRFAVLINEDYNKLFKKADIMSMVRDPNQEISGDSSGFAGGAQSAAKQTKDNRPLKPIVS